MKKKPKIIQILMTPPNDIWRGRLLGLGSDGVTYACHTDTSTVLQKFWYPVVPTLRTACRDCGGPGPFTTEGLCIECDNGKEAGSPVDDKPLLAAILLGREKPLASHQAAWISERLGYPTHEDLLCWIRTGHGPDNTAEQKEPTQ